MLLRFPLNTEVFLFYCKMLKCKANSDSGLDMQSIRDAFVEWDLARPYWLYIWSSPLCCSTCARCVLWNFTVLRVGEEGFAHVLLVRRWMEPLLDVEVPLCTSLSLSLWVADFTASICLAHFPGLVYFSIIRIWLICACLGCNQGRHWHWNSL